MKRKAYNGKFVLTLSVLMFVALEVLFYLMHFLFSTAVFKNIFFTVLLLIIPILLFYLGSELSLPDEVGGFAGILLFVAFFFIIRLWKRNWGASTSINWFSYSNKSKWLVFNVCVSGITGIVVHFKKAREKAEEEKAKKAREERQKAEKEKAEKEKAKKAKEEKRKEDENRFYESAQILQVSFSVEKEVRWYLRFTNPDIKQSKKYFVFYLDEDKDERVLSRIEQALRLAKFHGFKIEQSDILEWFTLAAKKGPNQVVGCISRENRQEHKSNYQRSTNHQEPNNEEFVHSLFILGFKLSDRPSQEELEKRHRTLAKEYHPDLWPEEKKDFAQEEIKKVNGAFDYLMSEFGYK